MAFKYTPPPTPLNSLWLSVVSSIPRRQTCVRRAGDCLALSHSKHSTFPLQIWRRPAVHLKRYARHSLLSPTYPPRRLTESRRSAIWHRCFDHKRRHTPPLSTSPFPSATAEMLTPADFFRWRGSLHRVESNKQASAWCKYGGVQLCI